MKNVITWFEIPANDIERAARFWETALSTKLKREDFLSVPHAIFGTNDGTDGVRGAIVQNKDQLPAAAGSRIYLGTNDIEGVMSRTPAAGGKVVLGKTSIGPQGFFALIEDTEGNVVGIHTPA